MSISSIFPGSSPMPGISPASSRSQTPTAQPRFGAGEDTFTLQSAGQSRPPSPATVQRTLGQADDFIAQMNQYTQGLQAGMPALPPRVGPQETFQDSTGLLNAFQAQENRSALERHVQALQEQPSSRRSDLLKGLNARLARTQQAAQQNPFLDGFAPDFQARLETLNSLKGQNIHSYFNQQTEALKARQAQENTALTARLGIQDTPELRAELAKQGMSPEEVEALLRKTGVQAPSPSQQAA